MAAASAFGLAPSVLNEIANVVVDAVARDESAVTAPQEPPNPGIILDAVEVASADPEPVEVVNRISTSGGRHWGVNVGRFNTRDGADRMLIRTALAELASLGEALRKVVNGPKGFEANFVGLTQEGADLACRRLAARGTECTVLGPPS